MRRFDGIGQDGNGGPETRIPAGFYPIRGRGWRHFHPRGVVAGHIIQPDMFRGCTPVSVVPQPKTHNTRQNTFNVLKWGILLC